MDTEETPRFSGGFRSSDNTAIEESGLFGTRRGWANINRYEVIFLIVGIIATIGTDSLTIIRLASIDNTKDPDLAYGILILVNSVFLLLFLITGIFQQRISDIVAFLISAVMLTIYVIVHYIVRSKGTDNKDTNATIRLIRLIFTCVFNVIFIPLSIFVIQDYQRDEYSKRLFGAFPEARRPLKIYNIFDCVARINTMISISTLVLNLYNFNDLESTDKILLGVGIPWTLLWLSVGIGMVRLESHILVGVFYFISLFQPGFLIYCLYSAIDHSPTSETTTTPFMTTTTTTATSTISFTATATSSTTTAALIVVPVPQALYVCIGTNFIAHILSMVFGFLCVLNFGKGLKERIFNNRFDKWFQQCWPKA